MAVLTIEPTADVRAYNVGSSDYATHKIQPWDIWISFKLNPFNADIVKRLLRKKKEEGMTETESRISDYQKIAHIAMECKRQKEEGICWLTIPSGDRVKPINIVDIITDYDMDKLDTLILSSVLSNNPDYDAIITVCVTRVAELKQEAV